MAMVLFNQLHKTDFDLSSVHSVISAAAPMSKELEQAFMDATKIQIIKQGDDIQIFLKC